MGNNHTRPIVDNNGQIICYAYDAQYINADYTSSAAYKWKSDAAGNIYRCGCRGGKFVQDRELYNGGFADAEGTGWVNLLSIS